MSQPDREDGPSTEVRRGRWELVDNADLGTHDQALRDLGTRHEVPIHVATGYLGLGGLQTLSEVATESRVPVRLLLGATPSADDLSPGIPAAVEDRFAQSVSRLRSERDFGAFPEERRRQLDAIREFLERDSTEVRRYVARFLHGKAYIFSELEGGYQQSAMVTSANLTGAGLNSNLELGMVHYQPNVVDMTLAWYDRLWQESEDFKDELLDLFLSDPQVVDPQTVYLRALHELFGDEDVVDVGESELGGFQRDGYIRAKGIMERHGGVLYADGVGMGKTEIGVEFIREFMRDKGQQVLVIAPAALRDGLWNRRLSDVNLRTQVVSYNALADDRQLSDGPNSRPVLDVDKDAYRLVIVDEAHAYRNANSSWWLALDRLMSGTRKSLLMLTATPVNNTLWDLHNLFALFARHDAAFADEPLRIRSLRKYFADAGATNQELLSPRRLFRLMDALVVRRHREFVMEHYPNQVLSEGVRVKFPTPNLIETRYDLDAHLPEAVVNLVTSIDKLEMARYKPSSYRIDGGADATEEYNSEFLKSMLLKRLESSWYAALKTVERLIRGSEVVVESFENLGVVPPRDLIQEVLDDADDSRSFSTKVLEAAQSTGTDGIRANEMGQGYILDVKADLMLLRAMQCKLTELGSLEDAKLATLADLMRRTQSKKAVIFTQFKETAEYLDRRFKDDSEILNGRKWVSILGSESSNQDRNRAVERFCPGSELEGATTTTDGASSEVDVLLSTDVLSEGQNLQQSQAVISYDMPWNPQRVVQRNGRVIRLKSPHDEVYLYTLMAEADDLKKYLTLEARLQEKIRAANAAVGMENPVLESVESVQRNYASLEEFTDRLAKGDVGLLDESEGGTNAALSGEYFRADLRRAFNEGEIEYIKNLPWGIGSAFRQTERFEHLPAVFFACRTKAGERYWRMVTKAGEVASDLEELEMLLRISPGDSPAIEIGDEWDLNELFRIAAEDIVEEHNGYSDPAATDATIPASQRWAVNTLRQASVANPKDEYDYGVSTLIVGRNTRVIRELSALRREYGEIPASRSEQCADAIVEVVQRFGLEPVEPPKPTTPITTDDIGVVCYQVVESPTS